VAALRRSHAPASVLRALAALRGFFRFLLAEGHTDGDPSEGLLGARLERQLPPVLSRSGIERLLDVVSDATPLGLRDRTILHVLYAAGCRVSEVVGLLVQSWIAEHEFLRVRGKGDKERLVPVSPIAAALLRRWLEEARPGFVREAGRAKDALFLSRTGRPLERGASSRSSSAPRATRA
jgi:integrase/recombinase XerD